MIAAKGPGRTVESSGKATSPTPRVWDAGHWVWDAAVVALVLAEPPAQGVGGGRDMTDSECFVLAPLQWQEVDNQFWAAPSCSASFAPFLLCVVLLTLLQGFSFRDLKGRGWAATVWPPSSIPAAKLHVATEAPAKAHESHRRSPLALVGFRSSGRCVGRGCGSWAASSPSPQQLVPLLSTCQLAAEGSVWQLHMVQSLTNENWTF